MRLAVITDEVSQDLIKVLELAKEFGLKGIEIRSVLNKGPHELDKSEIATIKKLVSDYGLEVCSIASPFFKCDYGDEAQYREHMEILRKCIDLAGELNAPIIRIFTFWLKPPFPSWDEIVEKLMPAVKIIESTNLILGIENEPSTMATNARKVLEVLNRLNHHQVRAVWDPGNDVFDPDREVPYPDGYETIKSWIVHVHIKDGKWNSEEKRFVPTPIGEGEVDYLSQFKALIKDGYKGYLSLETHWRPTTQLPEEIVQMPKGEQFSYMGDVATKECLTRLIRLLNQAGWDVKEK